MVLHPFQCWFSIVWRSRLEFQWQLFSRVQQWRNGRLDQHGDANPASYVLRLMLLTSKILGRRITSLFAVFCSTPLNLRAKNKRTNLLLITDNLFNQQASFQSFIFPAFGWECGRETKILRVIIKGRRQRCQPFAHRKKLDVTERKGYVLRFH